MHTWPLASSHWAVSASFSQQGLCKQPPTCSCISCHLSAGDLNSCCQICVPRSLPISPVHTGLKGKQDLSHREQLHGPTQGRAGSLLTGDWASEISSFQQDYTPASGFFFFLEAWAGKTCICVKPQVESCSLPHNRRVVEGRREQWWSSTTHGGRGGSGYVDRLAKSQEKGTRHRWWITDKQPGRKGVGHRQLKNTALCQSQPHPHKAKEQEPVRA